MGLIDFAAERGAALVDELCVLPGLACVFALVGALLLAAPFL
jgi:hypothetical protein